MTEYYKVKEFDSNINDVLSICESKSYAVLTPFYEWYPDLKNFADWKRRQTMRNLERGELLALDIHNAGYEYYRIFDKSTNIELYMRTQQEFFRNIRGLLQKYEQNSGILGLHKNPAVILGQYAPSAELVKDLSINKKLSVDMLQAFAKDIYGYTFDSTALLVTQSETGKEVHSLGTAMAVRGTQKTLADFSDIALDS